MASAKLLAAACALAAGGVASWESERTLALEQARGRIEASATEGGRYLSTEETLFPGLLENKGFDGFLSADKIARSRWSRAGTLLGGMLALPLGRREIHLLPPVPGEDDLRRLDAAGVTWVIWDVAGAGDVPAIIRQRSVENSAYKGASDVNVHVFRLSPVPRNR